MTHPDRTRDVARPRFPFVGRLAPVSGRSILALVALGVVAVLAVFPLVANPTAMSGGADVHVHHTWELVNRLALEAGQIPLWNPYVFSGSPGMADVQNQVFYPPSLLLRWLPLPAFFTWGLVFHLWLLGIGTFALCRELGTGRAAGLVAGQGVMLSGTIAGKIYAGHQVVLAGYAWFPLALALAVRSARCRSVWPHPALVAVLVAHLLAGFLQGSIYVFSVIGTYFVLAAWRAGRAGGGGTLLGQACVVFGLVFGLAAFQLLPTTRLLLEAGRAGGLDYGSATENAFTIGDLVTAAIPTARGLRHELWDSSMYVTLGLLVFAPLAWVDPARRRLAWCALALALGALSFAFGEGLPFFRLHYALFPQLRGPTRLLFFSVVGIAVLGGLGLDTLLRLVRADRMAARRFAFVPAVLGAALLLVVPLGALNTGGAGSVFGTPVWLVIAEVTGLVMVGVLARSARASLAGAVVVVLVATEGLVFATPMVRVDEGGRDVSVGTLVALAPSRVVSVCEHEVAPADLVRAGIPTTDGFGSISLGRYTRFLGLVQTGEVGARRTRLGQDTEALPVRRELLDFLDVSHVITCDPVEVPGLRLVEPLGSAYLYANTAVSSRVVVACPAEPRSAEWVLGQLARPRPGGQEPPERVAPSIQVRWVVGTSDVVREDKERRYRLARAQRVRGLTWRYDLLDASSSNVRALVLDPAAEDTDGIDRGAGRIASSSDDTRPLTDPSVLVTTRCDVSGEATILTKDRPDGLMRVVIETASAALVSFSEPYYQERRVWVDDVERPVVRTNHGFTGVRVEPGRHVVELRYIPTSLYLGMLVSGLAMLGWVGVVRQRRVVAGRR